MSRDEREKIAERFWSNVNLSGDDDCWFWTAATSGNGYGYFWVNGRAVGAHRVVYLLEHGDLPEHNANHECDNPLCVNPNHIWDGTQLENIKDMILKGRAAWQQD